jgi:hypothetical protein
MSLLTAFSKDFEKVIYVRLYQHLHKNNIPIKDQYGFRSNSSTDMTSYMLINKILSALNNKLKVGGIFCDLEKAFDCVNHNVLLLKLEFYGIEGKFNALIISYLKDRYQKVVIDNMKTINSASSEWKMVKHGVPQGSILGSLFFLLYVNTESVKQQCQNPPIC